ncbi:camphor resistance protein CrcB [Corynebacterium capitovis DSM 44611]|nr:camphor resistance protein CrcB [Corynebacterium capitovis DSM 44611]
MGTGAALGALVRLAVGASGAVAVTLALNFTGCFLMGLLNPGKFWGTGFLGGFTTFSAVSLAATRNSGAIAAWLMAAALTGCVLSWFAGDALRRRYP